MSEVGGGSWDSDAAVGDEHRARIRTCWLLLAEAVPGLLFAPVFGLEPLLLPIAVVLVACCAAVELCLRVKALRLVKRSCV